MDFIARPVSIVPQERLIFDYFELGSVWLPRKQKVLVEKCDLTLTFYLIREQSQSTRLVSRTFHLYPQSKVPRLSKLGIFLAEAKQKD